jgi:hypothetical protein
MTEQVNALLAIQKDYHSAAEMLNSIESMRAHIQDINGRSPTVPANVRDAGVALEGKLMEVEGRILDLRLTGRGQDAVRWPARLAGQLTHLANGIGASDFAPTEQQREVAALLARETRDVNAALRAVVNGDVARYNVLLRARGLPVIESVVF